MRTQRAAITFSMHVRHASLVYVGTCDKVGIKEVGIKTGPEKIAIKNGPKSHETRQE
jgi:hypothetical protein